MERARIRVFDTTLRDGEQSPGCSMNVREKLQMSHQLDRLGVDVIEAGFPIASDGDFEAVQAVSASIRRPIIAGLARSCTRDIERAWQALKSASHPRIHVFLATSDIHLKYKLRISRQQCLEQALEAVVEAGATTLNIPDTVGYAMPAEFGQLIDSIKHRVRGIEKVTISAHCHDDLGLAVANSLAAVAAGARQVECAINGIGERAGNASLEEIVMAMRVRPDLHPYDTGVLSDQLYPTSKLLSEITGVGVQPNKAIIGRNAFAHEAGIHQDGMLKNPLTYEIMTPQSVGVPDSRLVLGKHSGRHALNLRCEQLGFQFERRELDEIYRKFVVLADKIKHVEDHHLMELIRETHGGRRIPPAPVADLPLAIAAAAGSGRDYPQKPLSFPLPAEFSPSGLPLNPMAEHHSEQEDYLWGV